MDDLVRRNLLGFGQQTLGAFPIVVVQGARQVGKSTFAGLMVADTEAELVTLSFDHLAGLAVTTYLDVIETLFLVSHLPPWAANLTRREVGRSKSIIDDPVLVLRLSRLTPEQLLPLTGSDHLGGLLEGLVASELLKRSAWSESEYQLFHFRDRNGLEVDLVLEFADGRVFGIEVKASRTYKAEHFAGLRAFGDKLGDRFAGGLVLSTAARGYQYARGLWGLPISAVWEW